MVRFSAWTKADVERLFRSAIGRGCGACPSCGGPTSARILHFRDGTAATLSCSGCKQVAGYQTDPPPVLGRYAAYLRPRLS